MNTYTCSLTKCELFIGLPEEAYHDALKYLRAIRRHFQRGEIILNIGSTSKSGLVLDGEIECSYSELVSCSVRLWPVQT